MAVGERGGGGGGARPRCPLARFLVLVLFRPSQSLVPGVLAVYTERERETSCELRVWWDSIKAKQFLCKAIFKFHIFRLRNF